MDLKKIHQLFLESTGITTDTRKVNAGKLFVALKGDRFNGNDFALEAIKKGAIAAVVDEEIEGEHLIKVEDSLKCLQELANFHRRQFNIPVIALTGSNGKTTTKELIANILIQKYRIIYTQGNLNNHIGVPLSLFQINEKTEIAIIEMGANHIGEIAELCEIAEPTHGLITNIGSAHLEGFGGLEGVKKGKLELFEHIKKHSGAFFVNLEDKNLKELTGDKMVSFKAFENISRSKFPLEFKMEGHVVRSFLFGHYNLININAANQVGMYFKVDLLDRIFGIESYYPKNNRSQIISIGSNTVLLDAYNANPTSMMASIRNFAELEGDKMLIIGSMKELGDYEHEEHQKVIDLLDSLDLADCFLIGKEFKATKMPKGFEQFDSIASLKEVSDINQLEKKLILLKGSRSNRVEEYLNG